jgi:hypothetical protein
MLTINIYRHHESNITYRCIYNIIIYNIYYVIYNMRDIHIYTYIYIYIHIYDVDIYFRETLVTTKV